MVKRVVFLAAAGFALLCFVIAPSTAQQTRNNRNRNRRVVVIPGTLGAGNLIAKQRRAVHKRIVAMERQKQRLAKKGRNLNKGRGGNQSGRGAGRGG